ncbi:MAG TPA: LytTR family DNA-binding domain-containing protein [Chitinophagaceae bacterium]|nr:LytTR family DNA-binding domain-containing protein [Chitinophagaceae bacterium]
MIRTIIIDDEPSALNVLSLLLNKKCSQDVEIVATTTSPEEGISLILNHKPDLVFLDIEMPGMTGVELIRKIPTPGFKVVFVTAYDAYAIEAFELSAIDYLLKPIGADKVERVVNKILDENRKQQAVLNLQLQQLEKILRQHHVSSDKKIALGMSDKIMFVNISDILYCEARGPYTNVYLRTGKSSLTSRPLGEFELQLSEYNFFRIHHTYLINLNLVIEFQRQEGGYAVMENDVKLDVSQRRRKDFIEAMHKLAI